MRGRAGSGVWTGGVDFGITHGWVPWGVYALRRGAERSVVSSPLRGIAWVDSWVFQPYAVCVRVDMMCGGCPRSRLKSFYW